MRDEEATAEEVTARLASGEAPESVARWLYAGPAGRRPISVIKALRDAGYPAREAIELVQSTDLDSRPSRRDEEQ